jgi:hypothetical protein
MLIPILKKYIEVAFCTIFSCLVPIIFNLIIVEINGLLLCPIIGIIFLLTSTFFLLKKPEYSEVKKKITIVITMGILINMIPLYIYIYNSTAYTRIKAEIEYPKNNTVQGVQVKTRASVKNFNLNFFYTIAVKPQNTKSIYPQFNAVIKPVKKTNGKFYEFDGYVYLGGNPGDYFDIYLIASDKKTYKIFADYSKKNPVKTPGIDLPAGAYIVDSISVKLSRK